MYTLVQYLVHAILPSHSGSSYKVILCVFSCRIQFRFVLIQSLRIYAWRLPECNQNVANNFFLQTTVFIPRSNCYRILLSTVTWHSTTTCMWLTPTFSCRQCLVILFLSFSGALTLLVGQCEPVNQSWQKLLRAIKDWVQQFRCCIWAKFRSTFHIIDMYLELLNHSCG